MFGLFNKTKAYENVTAAEFEQLMANGNRIILDVRSRGEFSGGYIQGAKNIDVSGPDFTKHVSKLDPTKEYLVYCRSGMRSASACDFMTQNGFENVKNLRGGIMGWRGKVVR